MKLGWGEQVHTEFWRENLLESVCLKAMGRY